MQLGYLVNVLSEKALCCLIVLARQIEDVVLNLEGYSDLLRELADSVRFLDAQSDVGAHELRRQACENCEGVSY